MFDGSDVGELGGASGRLDGCAVRGPSGRGSALEPRGPPCARARALEPQVASAAAAGTARLSLLAALQPVAGHRCAEGHGSEGPVESGQPDGAAQRVEV